MESQARYMPSGSVEQKAEASQALSGALRGVFALAENYPDLFIARAMGLQPKTLFHATGNDFATFLTRPFDCVAPQRRTEDQTHDKCPNILHESGRRFDFG
jgi:hypothetical protein